MDAVKQFAGKLGPVRLMMMGGVAAAIFGLLAWVALPGSTGPMGYLYTELEPAAAQAIAEKLQAQNVPFQLSPDGTAVMAPQGQLAELRMTMAGDKLGGKIGYDILDEEQPFGVSSSRAKLNETRAIEGELARSIRSLENVSAARVHIVMPERALFAAEGRRATAAVSLKTLGRLSGENIQAIRYLVASSVPELSPEAVSIIDQNGALLARSGEPGAMSSGDADERQQAIEGKLREQIESLLEPIVGAGKVRAEVSATINRNQAREEASVVDPDKQAIAKQVTVESTDQNDETSVGGAGVSASTQLPESEGAQSGGGSGDSRRSAKNETSEDVTYENSRTSTVTVRPAGELKRLTVAVMIDSGKQPLPAPQVQRLQRLVENTVGFDAERGDSVVVEAMKFEAANLGDAEEGFLSTLPTDHLFSLLKVLIIAGVALLALRMLRPAIRSDEMPLVEGAPVTLLASAPAEDQAALPGALLDPGSARSTIESRGALLDQEIALAEVDGRIKLSAIKRIGDTVAASPAESTSVIRQWMSN